MNFIEAIKAIKRNENLRIKRGENTNVCYSSWYRQLYVEDRENLFDLELFVPTVDDILAEDWYVVKNEKLHTFEEALKAYKSGKNIKRKGDETIYRYRDYREFDSYDVLANDWIIIDNKEETK